MDWCLVGGIAPNCTLEVCEDEPINLLLKKGETLSDGLARLDRRLRELSADRHRVSSSPWSSSLVKAAAKAQIEMLAEAGTPDVDRAVEHNLPVAFATMLLTSTVRGNDLIALGHAEMVDTTALLCWVLHDEIVQKIHAAIDEIADDAHALDAQQREQALAQINGDAMEIHRSICALVWHAEMVRGEVIDFPSAEVPPEAVIGVRCVQAPRSAPSGTSLGHAIDIIGDIVRGQ